MTASFRSGAIAAAIAVIALAASPAMAKTAGKAVSVPASQVAWVSAGVPGVWPKMLEICKHGVLWRSV